MAQQSLVQNQTVPDISTPEVARPDPRQFSYLRRELGHVGFTDSDHNENQPSSAEPKKKDSKQRLNFQNFLDILKIFSEKNLPKSALGFKNIFLESHIIARCFLRLS